MYMPATMKKKLDIETVNLDSALPEPLYLQLANELQRIACCNNLNTVIKFPSQRELSSKLKLDRSTVKRTYEELLRREVVEYRGVHSLFSFPEARKKTLDPYPNIGIVVPSKFSRIIDNTGSLALRYFAGIIDSAAEKNIGTLMLQLPPPDTSQEIISAFLDDLSGRLMGVIHIGDRLFMPDNPLQSLLEDKRINQVAISAFPKNAEIGVVVADPSSGARALAEHLIQFGHKKIGFATHNENWHKFEELPYFKYESATRTDKIKKIFDEYALSCNEEHTLFSCNSREATYKKLAQLLKNKNLPDAFWCHNDETAGWVIDILESNGIKVPDDISIIGYDGYSPEPLYSKLTTINLPFYAIGVKAVEQLIEFQKNGITKENKLVELQTSLVMKKTLASKK